MLRMQGPAAPLLASVAGDTASLAAVERRLQPSLMEEQWEGPAMTGALIEALAGSDLTRLRFTVKTWPRADELTIMDDVWLYAWQTALRHCDSTTVARLRARSTPEPLASLARRLTRSRSEVPMPILAERLRSQSERPSFFDQLSVRTGSGTLNLSSLRQLVEEQGLAFIARALRGHRRWVDVAARDYIAAIAQEELSRAPEVPTEGLEEAFAFLPDPLGDDTLSDLANALAGTSRPERWAAVSYAAAPWTDWTTP